MHAYASRSIARQGRRPEIGDEPAAPGDAPVAIGIVGRGALKLPKRLSRLAYWGSDT